MATRARSFSNPKTPYQQVNAHSELVASLERILKEAPPSSKEVQASRTYGLYAGVSSTAYLFLRLSELYKDLKIQGQTLRQLSISYVRASSSSGRDPVEPSHCGVASETLVNLTLEALLEDGRTATQKAIDLCNYADQILESNDSQKPSPEWLYGRAGYLYLLRVLRGHIRHIDPSTADLISTTIDRVLEAIIQAPQPWTWHDKAYLGAAHGTIGIITQLVLTSPDSAPRLEKQLSDLLNLQFPDGNFPSSLPPHRDTLVQFCHGAPGFVASLISLRPYFPRLHVRIDETLRLARRCIIERGLLTKVPNLCHGISGNAIVLDDFKQMEMFLSYTTAEAMDKIDYVGKDQNLELWLSLYTGEAGRAWSWAVLDLGLEGKVIGYNDL